MKSKRLHIRGVGKQVAPLMRSVDRMAAALRLIRKSLDGQRKVLGEHHPDTIAMAEALRNLEAQQQN